MNNRMIVLTTPTSPTTRANLSLFVSYDEARTWKNNRTIFIGLCGYSDIQQFNDTHLAVLFENGVSEFSQQISFGLIDLSQLGNTNLAGY
jgi:hypothetical protein